MTVITELHDELFLCSPLHRSSNTHHHKVFMRWARKCMTANSPTHRPTHPLWRVDKRGTQFASCSKFYDNTNPPTRRLTHVSQIYGVKTAGRSAGPGLAMWCQKAISAAKHADIGSDDLLPPRQGGDGVLGGCGRHRRKIRVIKRMMWSEASDRNSRQKLMPTFGYDKRLKIINTIN